MNSIYTIRTFIAVEAPSEIKKTAAEIQSHLQSRFRLTASWTIPEGMHLTLKFLGDTPADKVEAIADALNEGIAGIPPFELTLSGPGVFGGRNPKVLWLGMAESQEIISLQKRVEDALRQFGFPKDDRPFHPHLTLARIKAPAGTAEMVKYLPSVETNPIKFSVGHVIMFRSDLKPAGPVYTELAVIKL